MGKDRMVNEGGCTVGPGELVRALARASVPRIRVISLMRVLTSRAEVEDERSWESLAWRQGWVEMWTLGRLDIVMVVVIVANNGLTQVDKDDTKTRTEASRPRQEPQQKSSSHSQQARAARRASTASRVEYDVPDRYANLDEAANVPPVQNPDEESVRRYESLEQERAREQSYVRDRQRQIQDPTTRAALQAEEKAEAAGYAVSRTATQIYTLSYLVFFSIFGTLARLGLQAITMYSGTPIIFTSIWPNFAGSVIMGFLAEDRMLFRQEWGTPSTNGSDAERGSVSVDSEGARKAHLAIKKTIPLYIGLATGFCGSFTSFSAFMRDVFLALSNDLPVINAPGRNGGHTFLALIAVPLITISMSLAGLFFGAHMAIFLEPYTPSLPFFITRKILDRLMVVFGWGCWLGAVIMSIFPPYDDWRGTATFALVFAPIGCLLRFYISLRLNNSVPSFPLGTFAVNIFGTAVLGMSWDLAHLPVGGVIGCQVLQGIQDGFCGCLTTVSTWVAELAVLRRRHAYIYAVCSVGTGLVMLVAIMGGLRWGDGWKPLVCTH
ncbi:CrcB-like protein-domain-containing protein [Triangularia verruculosa]|uniref:CrcB-like protein-domain-containing protein n=1 Tax=Triangularia verruculosa TaxID=2587418 RepID=A0AAN6XGY3_9PEZI|nr:CrcB-like protein-domain-containing protein [Triangularia verruculosa]